MQRDLPEGSDTSVDAVVGIYGRYDWQDRSTVERARFVDFLERVVAKRKIARHPEIFRNASPIARTHGDAPPFLVIHGSGDTVIPVQQATGLRREVARRLSLGRRLRGAARSRARLRHDRWRPNRVDGHGNRLVPQRSSPKPDDGWGKAGYIAA